MSKGGGLGETFGGIVGNIQKGRYETKAAKAAAAAAGQAYKDYSNKVDFNIGRLDPYNLQGGAGMSSLSGLLTRQQYDQQTGELKTLSPEQRVALFETSPGYKFRLDQGQKAVENSQAARGGLFSGRAATELGQFQQGEASSEYGNYINQLAQLAGMGQNAATNQASLGVSGAAAGSGMYLDSLMETANAARVKANTWAQTAPLVGKFGDQTDSSFSGGGGGAGGLGSFSTKLVNPTTGA